MSDLSQPTPTGHQRTTGGNFRWEPPTPEELQALMPGYTIEKILGRGGMGAVYKGVQTNLDRTVAIKVLPPGVEKEDPSFAERFKSEAKLMAKLNHPAVVAVYDFGTTLGGQLYFAMEYVDGSDVSQMIRTQGKLPPEHALAITAHVCDALAAAHELGIVHRDIKPANVLLNMKGQVKVADFGLAKVEEPGQHGLTKTGYAMGTPDFVAPEVLMLGSSIDGRADLYAVGVMLYQMLTGEVPRGAFKPATARIPGLDRRYDPIIIKAMQSDREERYQSSAELRRDLDVILTMPLVKQDDPASAAIPVSQVAQMPAQRSAAQKPMGKAPQPSQAKGTIAKPNHKSEIVNHKSRTPLYIGLGIAAALVIGAIILFSGGNKPQPNVVQASGLPPKAAETAATPSPAPAKAAEPPKSESKPVAAKSTPITAATPPKAEPPKPTEPKAAMPADKASTTLPVSKSPPLPVSASSEKFPPGQWVKVFTAEDSAPPDAMWRDGWLESIQPFVIPNFAATNMGVRMTLKTTTASSSKGYVATLKIRGTSDSAGPGNFLRLWKDGILTCGFIPASIPAQTADSVDLAKKQIDIKQGGPISLEYSVVTTHLFAKIDGSLMMHAQDQDVHNGSIRIYSSNPIRDIEVINLYGLPEAEALRIIGVDEKGNDTRAAALAAEKLAMDQKQVAQVAASIPELATLDEQFKKLTAERVSAPFEAEVAKLNAGYVGGIDRKIAEEKAAGHLDGVLALDAEKQLIQGVTASSRQPAASGRLEAVAPCPIPAEDATDTPPNLKTLRTIYRDAFTKLEATRAANLKALTDPLTLRLKQLESTLTQANRIDHAKTVREYREGLGRDTSLSARDASAVASDASKKTGVGKNGVAAEDTASKASQRETAEWLLKLGAKLTLKNGASRKEFKPGEDLPAGQIKVLGIAPLAVDTDKWSVTDDELNRFSSLSDLTDLSIAFSPEIKGPGLASLAKLPALINLQLRVPNAAGEHLAVLGALTKIKNLNLNPCAFSAQHLRWLAELKEMDTFMSGGTGFNNEHLALVAQCPKLKNLTCSFGQLTDDGLAALAGAKSLEDLNSHSNQGVTGTGLAHLTGLSRLRKLSTGGGPFEAKNLAHLAQMKNLESLVLHASTLEREYDESLKHLSALKSQIKELEIGYAKNLPDAQIEAIKKAMPRTVVTVKK